LLFGKPVNKRSHKKKKCFPSVLCLEQSNGDWEGGVTFHWYASGKVDGMSPASSLGLTQGCRKSHEGGRQGAKTLSWWPVSL
jgi:hypothetical protein